MSLNSKWTFFLFGLGEEKNAKNNDRPLNECGNISEVVTISTFHSIQ